MFTFLIVLLSLFVGVVILAISISFINHRLNSCGAIKITFEDFKRIFNKNKIYLKPYGNNYLNFILDIPSLTKNFKNSGLYSGEMKLIINKEAISNDEHMAFTNTFNTIYKNEPLD